MIWAAVVTGDLSARASARTRNSRIGAPLRHIERPLAGDAQLEDTHANGGMRTMVGDGCARARTEATLCRVRLAIEPRLVAPEGFSAGGADHGRRWFVCPCHSFFALYILRTFF